MRTKQGRPKKIQGFNLMRLYWRHIKGDTINELALEFNVSGRTIYRYLGKGNQNV